MADRRFVTVDDGYLFPTPLEVRLGAKIEASPKVAAIEARELPNRGRATIALFPGGIDSITVQGTYSIWSNADAIALGAPVPLAGSLKVYTFGSVVEHSYLAHSSAAVKALARRKSGTWNAWSNPGTDDDEIAALVAADTKFRTALRVNLPALKPKKIAAFALNTGNSGGLDTATSKNFRFPIRIAAFAGRWRVRMANINPRYGNKYPGALTYKGLGIARHAGETDPAKEGQFAGTVTSIAENFTTHAAGNEYVSPWVESSPIHGYAEYLLTGGYTCAAQENFAGTAGGWVTNSADDWNVSAPAGLTLSQSLPFNVWLELEVDEDVPVGAWFGTSLSSGVGARLGLSDSTPNKHGLAHGYVPTVYANSGTTMAAHADLADYKWTRYDSAAPAKPNFVLWENGSNDIFNAGGTFESVKAAFDACYPIVASKLSPNIGLLTVLPRHNASHAGEPVRNAWNEYLLTQLPGRALAVTDAAAALTNTDGSTLDQRYSASPTDIHLTAAGYVRYGALVPSMHR